MHYRMVDGKTPARLGVSLVMQAFIIFVLLVGFTGDAMPPGEGYASSGGDANGDGTVDIGDAVFLLNHLFVGGEAPAPCPPSGSGCSNSGGDANGDGLVNIADSIAILSFLFQAGPDPVACPPENPIEDANIPAGFTFQSNNAQGYPEYTHDDTGILFVRIPSDSFLMGSTSELDAPYSPGADETPLHMVTLSPFLMAKMEVSQQEYFQVTGSNPSAHVGDNFPVEQISWNDLNAPGGFLELTGFSLPTEAQWEYACRGGTTGPFSGIGDLALMGCYLDNSSGETFPGGSFEANDFGLLDMHGNVWEWTQDNYNAAFYSDPCSSGLDPVYDSGMPERVVRGGAYNSNAYTCRSANRYFLISLVLTNDSVGFRPVFNLTD
ncbi:MAG: SUMF1/EgtB/PvdO family nonheme iron enzyme [Planctomycetota bacterium]|nr:SUMF1/EgtB/PvdO family nonheme iron enzyme [Planctomycetota bacterium]